MQTAYTCTLLRRFAAILYDSIVLIGLIFLAAVPPTLLYGGGISEPLPAFGMQLYLLAVAFAFFGGFWTHGGQTIGMRAWRIRVVDEDGHAITWRHALIRFLAAILSWVAVGVGFAWSLFDAERLTWHDRLSGTRTVHLPAQSQPSE